MWGQAFDPSADSAAEPALEAVLALGPELVAARVSLRAQLA